MRRIRDLNDEINKLIREKGHWVRRIVELGGPDYSLTAQKVTDSEGKEMAGATGRGAGYRYFGAAKNLPGVKELFEKEGPRKLRRTRFDMHKAIDADYFGFRDEDDGILVKLESVAERAIRKRVRSPLPRTLPVTSPPASRCICTARSFENFRRGGAVFCIWCRAKQLVWQSACCLQSWFCSGVVYAHERGPRSVRAGPGRIYMVGCAQCLPCGALKCGGGADTRRVGG